MTLQEEQKHEQSKARSLVEGHRPGKIGKDAVAEIIVLVEKVAHDLCERRIGLTHQFHRRQELLQFLCTHRVVPACKSVLIDGMTLPLSRNGLNLAHSEVAAW